MKTEKNLVPFNGYFAIVALLLSLAFLIFGIVEGHPFDAILAIILSSLILKGFIIISPNSAKVLLLFGDYKGTIKQNGLFWVNPFFSRITLSMKARNFESEKIKVNDKMGNPILISVILVWKVEDTEAV